MKRYRSNPAAPVPEQAAEWLVELDDPGVDDVCRRRFMLWLRKSPQHIEEFLSVAAMQQEVARQSSAIAPILAEVRATVDQQQAVQLFGESAPAQEPVRAVQKGRKYVAWASAAALALIALLVLRPHDAVPPDVNHTTGLGEQRSIVLDDGSIITLNTLSDATVRFDSSTRTVDLHSGEAMFDVVSDPERPFVVETSAMALNVLGTKFSVYRQNGQNGQNETTRLAVVEGTVFAVSHHAPQQSVTVRTGEGAVATAQGITLADPRFDVATAVAWTERRLIFDGAPLAEVVREFNRYNRVPLVVEDGPLASRAITTVFNAHDVSALVAFLELEPDVEVVHRSDSIRIRVRH